VVGNYLIRHQLARHAQPAMPLDWCGAESQGSLGYLLHRTLAQLLTERGRTPRVAGLLSIVEVDLADEAFRHPTKPIGPYLSAAEAQELEKSGSVVLDAAHGLRRVVASPVPLRVFETEAVVSLLDAGFTVITLGGGGVPVAWDGNGLLVGVEAVIDKDLSSSLLAREIRASDLIILTDVDRVYLGYQSDARCAIARMTVKEAERYLRQGEFLAGSMAPKMQAAIAFLQGGGRRVLIGLPESLSQLFEGKAGTEILPS
jgi:carbamate kinase